MQENGSPLDRLTRWTCYLLWVRFFFDVLGSSLLFYLVGKWNPLFLGLSLALFASSLGLYFKRQKVFSYLIIAILAYTLIRQAITLFPLLSTQEYFIVIGPLAAMAYDGVLLVLAVLSLKKLMQKKVSL